MAGGFSMPNVRFNLRIDHGFLMFYAGAAFRYVALWGLAFSALALVPLSFHAEQRALSRCWIDVQGRVELELRPLCR